MTSELIKYRKNIRLFIDNLYLDYRSGQLFSNDEKLSQIYISNLNKASSELEQINFKLDETMLMVDQSKNFSRKLATLISELEKNLKSSNGISTCTNSSPEKLTVCQISDFLNFNSDCSSPLSLFFTQLFKNDRQIIKDRLFHFAQLLESDNLDNEVPNVNGVNSVSSGDDFSGLMSYEENIPVSGHANKFKNKTQLKTNAIDWTSLPGIYR